jgi:plastocyanin
MNRRRFSLLGLGGIASAALVACGNDIGDEQAINPTKIPDVPGAPKPTLADMATPGGEAPEGGGEAGGGEAGGGAAAVTVHTLDTLKFDPPQFTVSPGTVITVENTGFVQHDFVIDEFVGEPLVGPLNGGESGTWTVPADAALGDYIFYCSLPGHRQGGMEGTMTIGEASAAPPADGGEASPAAEATPAAGEQPPAGGEAPPAAAGPITVHTLDTLKFDPPQITASPGTVITVENAGFVQHDFVIDELSALVGPLNNGESGEWTVPADAAPGDYVYYCSIPGHRQAGMEGTLTIG